MINLQNFLQKRNVLKKELAEKYGSDFEVVSGMGFRLNKAEAKCISDWVKSLEPEIMAKSEDSREFGVPYYGAMGGGVSYTFTPTSLGDILIVKEAITGKELNVTDALGWYFFG